MNINPYYEQFSNHPFIKQIANNEKWTISTKDKIPVDMYILMYRHYIAGAKYNDNLSLVSLPTLNNTIPNAANYAYYLNSIIDNFVVLDIEPKCPDDLKEKFLKMNALYIEKSMSGKGIHMVFPLPKDILNKYPNAQTKRVFKDKQNGYYEILLNHYITFTGNIIQRPENTKINTTAFNELFEQMASEQINVQRTNVDFDEIKPVETKLIDKVFELLKTAADRYYKKPSDFANDMSRWEYAYVSYLNAKLYSITQVSSIKEDHIYDDAEKTWILYTIVKETIPYRSKHDETRYGLPWLIYLIREVMAKSNTKQNK